MNKVVLRLRSGTNHLYSLSESASRRVALSGQSLAEILIATAIIAIFIGGVAGAVSISLQVLGQNKYIQNATFLTQEILDHATVLAKSDWHRMDRFGADALTPSPTEYRITTPAPFEVASGAETVTLDGIDYTRYFSVEWVSRDAGKNIESIYDPAREDLSTIKIISTVTWPGGGSFGLVKYLTRGENKSSLQTDWSGGAGQVGALTDPGKYDTASAGIDVTSKSGSIRLSGIPY